MSLNKTLGANGWVVDPIASPPVHWNAEGTAPVNPVTGASIRYGSHVRAALIGDSLTGRHRSNTTGIIVTNSAMGVWNWANSMIGAPFHFVKNLGVSGDKTKSIMSRIEHIPANVQVVFLWTGTNDVLGVSAIADAATVDAAYTSITTDIGNGVAALRSAGKIVVMGTIPPNNAYTAGDSRIGLLDRVNTYISGLASTTVLVADVFTALWDGTASTRVFAANTYGDATHPNNNGSMLGGKAAMAAAQAAYSLAVPDVDIYEGWELCRQLYASLRSGTGGDAAVKTNGTGTLADGWRSRNAVGTATFTLSNATAYSPSADFVGPFAECPRGIDSYVQEFNISAAAAADDVQFMIPSGSTTITNLTNFPDNVLPGDEFFVEADVEVASPVNLANVVVAVFEYHTAGTSPADQPYTGTTYTSAQALAGADHGITPAAYASGFRGVMRTPIAKVPENINVAAGLALNVTIDAIFNGVGSAIMRIGRPRIWHKQR